MMIASAVFIYIISLIVARSHDGSIFHGYYLFYIVVCRALSRIFDAHSEGSVSVKIQITAYIRNTALDAVLFKYFVRFVGDISLSKSAEIDLCAVYKFCYRLFFPVV